MAALTVRELMTQNPTWCTPQDAVAAVARLMVACNCGALPVVEDPRTRRLAGIITDRDIVCRVVAKGLSPVECRVREAMTPDPASLHLDATVDDCVRTMETLQVRRGVSGAPVAAMHEVLTLSVCKRRDAVRLGTSEAARPPGAASGVSSGATSS